MPDAAGKFKGISVPRIPWHKGSTKPLKILATSDLHGCLPEIPECDLLLIGGDITPLDFHDDTKSALEWLDVAFREWLLNIPAKHIIGIAGNHDFVFERLAYDVQALSLPWEYLQDELTHYQGMSIYGTPWVPNLPRWAFHQTKKELAQTFEQVPYGTDIVLSHGPPRGYGDELLECHLKASEGLNSHCGSKAALNMLDRVKPKAFVTGHIHEAFGHYRFKRRDEGFIDIYNVAFVDEIYNPRGLIVEVILDGV